eukprot:comp20648_c0_seq1/m.42159 comp20648_c0_seq1/g.42159  ORF comp20648_c0_seq1/g.42159 comp20648_c0_seq1/m.42159 type:complete len:373 (-) comp20648_c0_seq1:814-1932(-)
MHGQGKVRGHWHCGDVLLLLRGQLWRMLLLRRGGNAARVAHHLGSRVGREEMGELQAIGPWDALHFELRCGVEAKERVGKAAVVEIQIIDCGPLRCILGALELVFDEESGSVFVEAHRDLALRGHHFAHRVDGVELRGHHALAKGLAWRRGAAVVWAAHALCGRTLVCRCASAGAGARARGRCLACCGGGLLELGVFGDHSKTVHVVAVEREAAGGAFGLVLVFGCVLLVIVHGVVVAVVVVAVCLDALALVRGARASTELDERVFGGAALGHVEECGHGFFLDFLGALCAIGVWRARGRRDGADPGGHQCGHCMACDGAIAAGALWCVGHWDARRDGRRRVLWMVAGRSAHARERVLLVDGTETWECRGAN